VKRLERALDVLGAIRVEPIDGAPAAEITVAPRSFTEAAQVLDLASGHGLRVLVWGGGEHQGLGGRVEPDIVLSTAGLDRITAWQPDDLTVVVEAGVSVAELETRLAERGQTALLPEVADGATVGGVVAAGVSSWRRLRYGPTRDRVLEVVLVTGDGRVVRGGGQVVKNVTGYDLPRLATGSLGGLGLIGRMCLKLWPQPAATATITVSDPERARTSVHRPLAMISERERTRVYLGGHPSDVQAQVDALEGNAQDGLDWPEDLTHEVVLSLRIPPRLLDDATERVPPDCAYQAEHGVGQIRLGCSSEQVGVVQELREWAEHVGGALVVVRAPEALYGQLDPWGTPPPSQELQRRVVVQFDPCRIVNPGRLPGGL
jgi:hypothetical protein